MVVGGRTILLPAFTYLSERLHHIVLNIFLLIWLIDCCFFPPKLNVNILSWLVYEKHTTWLVVVLSLQC